MHPYITDGRERRIVPLLLTGVAMLAAAGVHLLLVRLEWTGLLPAEIALIAVYYRVADEAFDRWGWRFPPLRTAGLVAVPDLAGRWQGELSSTRDGKNKTIPATLHVTQTWRSIQFRFEGQLSAGTSDVAAILIHRAPTPVIVYTYVSVPRLVAAAALTSHHGMTSLTLSEDGRMLTGDYFTGREGGTFGTVTLERKPGD